MTARRIGPGQMGDVAYYLAEGQVTASVYYRTHEGRRLRARARAGSKAAARRLVLAAVAERLQAGNVADFTTRTTLADVAEPWHAGLTELAEAGRRSPTTIAL